MTYEYRLGCHASRFCHPLQESSEQIIDVLDIRFYTARKKIDQGSIAIATTKNEYCNNYDVETNRTSHTGSIPKYINGRGSDPHISIFIPPPHICGFGTQI